MKNLELAQGILKDCWNYGVREIILCAGARNAPFVKALDGRTPFKIYSFFEERSATFFALGRMQSEGRPVAVVTTSGTAAAELLPACIEADYQGLPLVMITADRPRRYRGSGAPQTIVQPGLFSHYTAETWDVEGEWRPVLSSLKPGRPLHLNVCFDEPLMAGEVKDWNLSEGQARDAVHAVRKGAPIAMKRPLVIAGGLRFEEAEEVAPMLAAWKRPLLLEGPSHLRGHPLLREWQIEGGEKSLTHLDFDGVIRIGHVPTLRYWRDLETSDLPVANFSSSLYSGLPRVKEVRPLSDLGPQDFEEWSASEKEIDRGIAAKRDQLLNDFPLSEPAWVGWLSRQIPADARLFLGNSLPVREWDFAAHKEAARDIFANRGTNGIDGLISTFAGAADSRRANWALLGDLSVMYDLSGPWALRERPLAQFNLAVINNGGGQIFNRMFRNPMFLNAHDLRFGDWAKMWGLSYTCLKDERTTLAGGRQVIEILPDARQTEDFWRAWEST